MKKQELIHLHALLGQVRDHYEEETDQTVELEEYSSLGVRPTSIHKSKTDHKEALYALAEGLSSKMDAEISEGIENPMVGCESELEEAYEEILRTAMDEGLLEDGDGEDERYVVEGKNTDLTPVELVTLDESDCPIRYNFRLGEVYLPRSEVEEFREPA